MSNSLPNVDCAVKCSGGRGGVGIGVGVGWGWGWVWGCGWRVSTCIGYSDVHNVDSCFPMAY